MDGDGGDEFGMLPGEVQDVIVRDVVGADVFHFFALVVVNFVLGENDNCAKGGATDQVEQSLDVKIFEIALDGAERQADVPQHHRSHGPMPATNVKPAAAVAGAVADDMDVHVDGFEGRGGWLGGGHGGIVWEEVARCRLKVASWERQIDDGKSTEELEISDI
jgi:hypothetical protein